MRAVWTVLGLLGCTRGAPGAGSGPGGVPAASAGTDTGDGPVDTGPLEPPEPAWLQLGSARVRATHASLSAMPSRVADLAPGGLSLESRGWATVGFAGTMVGPRGVEELGRLAVETSERVDAQAYVEGTLVPGDPCVLLTTRWAPPDGALESVWLDLEPEGGRSCEVDGGQRPPLMAVDLGGVARVSFSGEVLSLVLGDGAESCTLRVQDGDETTLEQAVDCAVSVGWEDGAGDALPGGVRLSGGVLQVGVVGGSGRLLPGS